MFLLFSIFIFDLVSVSLSPFEFYLFLCRICCFTSCLRYFIYYHFYYQLSREIFWPKNVGQRPKVSFFFLLDTSIYVLFFFFTIIILYGAMFYVLLNSCFDLLSVSLKIADSSVFGTLRRVSFPAKLVAGGLKLGKKWGLGCSKNIMPSASVLRCFQLSWSILLLPSFVLIYLWILWIFYFTNYYFITCTGNPGRLMSWSFLKK